MVDHIVDVSAPRGRVEIRNGVGRRRRWSNADKGRIVAESFAPGAVVSEVARRHEISPQHLFAGEQLAKTMCWAHSEILIHVWLDLFHLLVCSHPTKLVRCNGQ